MGKLIRALGILITLAAVAVGIWLQTLVHVYVQASSVDRALFVLIAISAVGIGVLVIAAGHLIMLRESHRSFEL